MLCGYDYVELVDACGKDSAKQGRAYPRNQHRRGGVPYGGASHCPGTTCHGAGKGVGNGRKAAEPAGDEGGDEGCDAYRKYGAGVQFFSAGNREEGREDNGAQKE